MTRRRLRRWAASTQRIKLCLGWQSQVAQGFYDRNANLALLRLYNFETELVHVQTVANVLIMALMQLPEADFTMLLHLIPENIQVCIQRPP